MELRYASTVQGLRSVCLLCFAGGITIAAFALIKAEGPWTLYLGLSALVLVGVSVSILRSWTAAYLVGGGLLTVTAPLACAATSTGPGWAWAALLLCLCGLLGGARLAETTRACPLGGKGGTVDRMSSIGLLRDASRTFVLLGASFLIAAMLLSLVGLLVLGDLPLVLLALLMPVALWAMFTLITSGPESER